MDHGPLDSSNGSQSENQSTAHSLQIPLPFTNEAVCTSNDCDSSDRILRYIDQILMEEDIEPHMLHDSSDLRAKERSFYEVLGQNYPPSPQQESPYGEEDEVNIERSSHSEAMGNYNVPIQEFDDDVWVYTVDGRDEKLAAYIANLRLTGSSKMPQGGLKIRRNVQKKGKTGEVIDLSAILIDCAQSVSAGNHHIANFFLRQIRQHSSPFGNGTQRLAHYLAAGMEARMSGIGKEIHIATNPANHLRAYCMAQISSSLRKISSFTSNKTIIDKSEKASRIHIIDFGILNGCQWQTFIKCVAEREGGPPKLRITGVDFPQAEGIIEETGNRLTRYAETFDVLFDYKAIAQEWETIKIEDLKIEKGEFVAVICSFRAMNLMDTVMDGVGESPRDMFLKLIREINPDIFIHGIVNGGYNQPHFVYRFRELLFHFSTLFDMLETFLPRDRPERMMIERDILGKEALNVIACEGTERVERPETCRHWKVRHVRAGFMQVPFERKLKDAIMNKVRNVYHRDFVLGEDNMWMCTSWKGRVIHAISCWQPAAF